MKVSTTLKVYCSIADSGDSSLEVKVGVLGDQGWAHLGNTRLYKEMHTVSIWLIGASKWALKYPCVPSGSRMWPVRPNLVCSWIGLKYRTSSAFGRKN